MRLPKFISKPQKTVVLCQYQEKIVEIPKEDLFKIPGLISAIPDAFLPHLVGIQVYKTYAVRFNFSNDPALKEVYFRPGCLVSTSLSDETVSTLCSMIMNA